MPSITELFANLERSHFLAAIEQLGAGTASRFADSKKFDVLFQRKRYAPKEVAGLALEDAHHRSFGPSDFKGGENTPCFHALMRCGFTIVPKASSVSTNSLVNVIREILQLQTDYSPENTPAMQRRGNLVRGELKDILYSQIESFEPIFSASGYECSIECRDGIGRKTRSPWARIFDPKMSSSATDGWYVVIHFSSKGDFFYATIGCGATHFKGGSLTPVESDELAAKVKWAKGCFDGQRDDVTRFQDKIELHGNELSTQFERAIAFAKRYSLDQFDEAGFWDDLTILCKMLIHIYEQERQGKVPFTESPEVREYQSNATQTIRPRAKAGRGQGRFLTAAEKSAVELRAMTMARDELTKRAFEKIEDKSANSSYDFSATKMDVEWFVEVKGTTSPNADSFLLTANELELHQNHKGRTILAIAYDIDLIRRDSEPTAEGGKIAFYEPWEPDDWVFKATAFSASRKK